MWETLAFVILTPESLSNVVNVVKRVYLKPKYHISLNITKRFSFGINKVSTDDEQFLNRTLRLLSRIID